MTPGVNSLLLTLTLVTVYSSHAQTGSTVDISPELRVDRGYEILRENEDWSFLRDRNLREDEWDPIKYIPLRSKSADRYISVGGEAR